MSERERRRELVADFQRSGPAAGVYRVSNRATGKVLIGSAANLAGVRNRLEFAKSTRSPMALDPRLRPDAERFGLDSLEFEVLDTLDTEPPRTAAQTLADLETLEQLRLEEVAPERRY